ncbi:hypothetical protein FKG94_00510 [Exilibacterium tricleocarpae]|uniref:Uncharacterized protein n=1 Tax=Exilibacterium tricleocarpae TaxID=2591008 RepID=A0A545U9C2_9GAMM|nr:hypothetical protein [Exilibacterium tricleocarpae]TQV86076.1 hypothetical protein FKG94_00510 [Exilibacterium tricleocarpae]
MNKKAIKKLVLITLIGLSPSWAWSTSLIKMSSADMVDSAVSIIHGRCTGVTSQWVKGSLVTKATISVTDTLKGIVDREITLVVPGGVDRTRAVPVAVTYPGIPTLTPNEEMILFLENSNRLTNAYSLVGFSQGFYAVVNNGTSSFAARRMDGKAEQLEAFKEKIRRLVK